MTNAFGATPTGSCGRSLPARGRVSFSCRSRAVDATSAPAVTAARVGRQNNSAAWAEANYRAGKPIFADQPDLDDRQSSVATALGDTTAENVASEVSFANPSEQLHRESYHASRPPEREIRKIAFASPHCLIDYYSGAAIASFHALQLLQGRGFQCRAFCGSQLDVPQEVAIDEVLAKQQLPFEQRRMQIGNHAARMLSASHRQMPVNLFAFASSRGNWPNPAEIAAFLGAYEKFLDEDRPDVVITYGGSLPAMNLMALTKKRDIPLVFALHNCQYRGPDVFDLVDYVAVPSEFCRRYYWDAFGLACMKLPNVIDWHALPCASGSRVLSPT